MQERPSPELPALKHIADEAQQDRLYEQILAWIKEDNAMTIARVQIRLRLGYSRARGLVERARRELRIEVR